MKSGGVVGDIRMQGPAGWSQVAATGSRNSCRPRAVAAGRWPRPEVVAALELLRQQGGAYKFAVLFDQTSVGLFGKYGLREERHDHRIHDSSHDTPQNGLPDGLGDKFNHNISLFVIVDISDIRGPDAPPPAAHQLF